MHHLDDVTGSLTVGKFADLVILDRDLFALPDDAIADARVSRTLIGGRTVYDDGSNGF